MYSDYNGERLVVSYTVVAKDEHSVVVKWTEGGFTNVKQIFFDTSDRYYLVSGYNVEFFVRVRK